ncbi:MAG: glycosyltransferase family 4 protein [Chloroflexi bacterium]|nr:glycosyltransferase family 4 protein [Chloroflexota bacterium]
MKVLLVHPAFWVYGGAEKVIVRLANYLTEHNIDNAILTTKMLPEIKKELTETRLIECENFENMINMLHSISNDFDVINIHNEPCQLMAYPKYMNTVWSFNELPQKIQLGGTLPEMDIKFVKNFIKKVIVADEVNKEKFIKVYGLKPISIIPYGIDFDFFQEPIKTDMRERYNLNKDDFVITQVAFIAPTKNQLESVKILAEVKKKIPNAKLILAGLPLEQYKKDVEQEIMKNKLYADVIFTGKLTSEEVRDLLKVSNCALQPNKGQGSWLSVFEAMACRLGVVVSKEFTASKLVEENGGIACSTTEEYVKAITEGVFTYAQEFVKTELTWDNYCEKVVEVFYESIIN